MKTLVYDSMGLKWNISVPATVAEYDTLAGRPETCLGDATDHTVYHDTLGDIRYEFSEAVAKALAAMFPERAAEFARAKKPTGETDDEGVPVMKDENDGSFLNRILALSGKSVGDFTAEKTAVETKVKFDPSVRERKPGAPKTTPKSALIAANDLLMLHGKDVEGNVVDCIRIAKGLEKLNPDAPKAVFVEATGLPTQESLGKLVAANEARKRASTKLSKQYVKLDDVG